MTGSVEQARELGRRCGNSHNYACQSGRGLCVAVRLSIKRQFGRCGTFTGQVPCKECLEVTGKSALRLRWVDTHKIGDPNVRSRLVAT